ncbi:hypothetical protein Tco_1252037 [Tanacetum coccineum]
MADMNIPANDVPAEQAPAFAPLTRTDDQILPLRKWVPVGKSNCVLDVLKSQRNLIFKVAMAILKNTNFFRAFTASSTILAIYIQQFWDTMRYDTTTGIYSCQLDEQWFNLHKDILRDALQISPINDNNPFVAPPSSDAVILYVNTLGYPCTLRNVSAMSVNDLYQPWRAILSMINMCLTGKTARHDRPRHHVLQILWGSIHRFNINYAERIWEEFNDIDKKMDESFYKEPLSRNEAIKAAITLNNFLFEAYEKTAPEVVVALSANIHLRTGSPLHYSHEDNVLSNLRFIGKDGREVFGIPIPDALLIDAIKRAPYYSGYLAHVAEYQRNLDGEHGMAEEEAVPESTAPKATKVTKPKAAMQTNPSAPKAPKATKLVGDKASKPTSSQPPKPTPTPTKSSKKVQGKKRKLVKKTSDAPSPAKQSKAGKVIMKRKSKSPLRLVDEFVDEGGTGSGIFQPLSKLQGKGKEKVIDEQAAHDLLTLQTQKKKSPADQFIFQRRTPMTIEPSRNAESPSLDAELALADSETESDEIVTPVNIDKDASNKELTEINVGVQDEARLDQTLVNKMKARLDQTLVILEEPASSTGTLSSLQILKKELNFTNQFFVEKPQEEEPEKTNSKSEVQLMVTVPIHQDTSSVPPMTTPVIDLITSQSDSLTIHAPLPTSTAKTIIITTTTTLPPPPPQP